MHRERDSAPVPYTPQYSSRGGVASDRCRNLISARLSPGLLPLPIYQSTPNWSHSHIRETKTRSYLPARIRHRPLMYAATCPVDNEVQPAACCTRRCIHARTQTHLHTEMSFLLRLRSVRAVKLRARARRFILGAYILHLVGRRMGFGWLAFYILPFFDGAHTQLRNP